MQSKVKRLRLLQRSQNDYQKKPSYLNQVSQSELKNLDFNKAEYDYFIKNCNFTDRQKEILDLRRKGSSIISISLKLYLSERTINREIKKIKSKILKVI